MHEFAFHLGKVEHILRLHYAHYKLIPLRFVQFLYKAISETYFIICGSFEDLYL